MMRTTIIGLVLGLGACGGADVKDNIWRIQGDSASLIDPNMCLSVAETIGDSSFSTWGVDLNITQKTLTIYDTESGEKTVCDLDLTLENGQIDIYTDLDNCDLDFYESRSYPMETIYAAFPLSEQGTVTESDDAIALELTLKSFEGTPDASLGTLCTMEFTRVN